MDFCGQLVLEHGPRLAAAVGDAAAGDARSTMADGKHGHADGHNGVVGHVADRPAMATGIFVVAYRRKQPCAYRCVLFNLHQLPSHRNDISNADLGAGVKQLSASVKGGERAHWCIALFTLLPIGSLLKFLLARPANLPFLSRTCEC